MTVFGRVLCPLQPCCLPPLHAAQSLPSYSSVLLSTCFSTKSTTHFSSTISFFSAHHCTYQSFLVLLFSSHPVTTLLVLSPQTLFCSSSFSLLFPLLFVPVITSCVSPPCSYPSPPGSCSSPVYSPGCALGAGSAGLWPVLPFSHSPNQPRCTIHTCQKMYNCTHVLPHKLHTNSFVLFLTQSVLSPHLQTGTHRFVTNCPLFHMLNLRQHINTHTQNLSFFHTHTCTFQLLAAGLITWKMNTKSRAKWLAKITLAVCSVQLALCWIKTGPPLYLTHLSEIPS